jgi:hypothetical protein
MSASAPTLSDEKGQRDLVKNLADAVSMQADVTNRTWLALISVAVVALIPHMKDVTLPFSLGDVPQPWFHGVIFYFLVVLAIAFASAHSQQVRAQKLAQLVIDTLGPNLGSGCAIHPRDFFDIQRKASLIHIASLAQSLRGKYQFYTTATGLPIWQKKITVFLYGVWKTIGFIIYFVFPIVALWKAHQDFSASGLLYVGNIFFTGVAIFALGQVLLLDLLYAITIFKQLLQPARQITHR